MTRCSAGVGMIFYSATRMISLSNIRGRIILTARVVMTSFRGSGGMKRFFGERTTTHYTATQERTIWMARPVLICCLAATITTHYLVETETISLSATMAATIWMAAPALIFWTVVWETTRSSLAWTATSSLIRK